MSALRIARAEGCRWAVRLIVCSAAVVVPAMGYASCGDYLSMPHHGGAPMARHSEPGSSPATPLPCRGPNCGRSTPPAAPTAPVTWERANEQWACLSTVRSESPALAQGLLILPPVHGVAGHPARLDRPPRDLSVIN